MIQILLSSEHSSSGGNPLPSLLFFAAIFAAIDRLSDEDLDKPSPAYWQAKFPTIGSLAVILASHTMMHVGQWVPVRRKLQKPVLI